MRNFRPTTAWRSLLATLLISLGSSQAHAAWYEVTGSAVIMESNTEARRNALEDAVLQAMDSAGADIGNFNNIKPYLTNDRDQYQFSGSEIRHISVVKSQKKSGKYYLTARIDIYPSAKSCHQVQYKKGLLLSEFRLESPQHASLGGVYQIGQSFTNILQKQIAKRSQSFVVSDINRYPVDLSQPNAVTMLASDQDAQYIITGSISDLTSTLDQKLLRDDQINRQFAANMQIIDGKTGEILLQNNYREIAEWPFSRVSQVDTNSARFWQSKYGQAVLRVSRNMMLDMESALSCRASLPEVIGTFGNTVQINVGRIHGVEPGDELTLWHSAGFIDQNGIARNRMVQTHITLTVDRVYEKSSELLVNQPELAASIQPGDLVTKQQGK
ncbi:flagellar basal-body protein [Photobacterium aquae]|uniref:Flagellar basal-body protein n=1 Tax=Photobacterium aquae TaxID=1195763 RepID=A0A0J1H2N9_9GAMM|nr:flagella assembly protein FlgT [Photobacterium aquae]KLV06045.1 flagellar basal-body protein [Photobacterium aquae]